MRVFGRLTGLMGALLLMAFSLLVGLAQDTTTMICPRGQGFWANHPENWTITTIVIGGREYTQVELLQILPGGGGDASNQLLVQLVAAKLNVESGVASPLGTALIEQADALLLSLGGGASLNIHPSSPEGQQLLAVMEALGNFNSGALVVGCPVENPEATPEATAESTAEATQSPEATAEATAEATQSPEATPEATAEPGSDLPVIIIIEGPVQSININIITIYGIDIELDANDPILTVIQIGDILRIEGDLAGSGTTIVIVAVNITIVNVEVFINVDGQIFRDDSDCSNPPPPWAPANGWRRRCEGGGGGNNGGGNGNGKKSSKKSKKNK
jgi:hypothetical protein